MNSSTFYFSQCILGKGTWNTVIMSLFMTSSGGVFWGQDIALYFEIPWSSRNENVHFILMFLDKRGFHLSHSCQCHRSPGGWEMLFSQGQEICEINKLLGKYWPLRQWLFKIKTCNNVDILMGFLNTHLSRISMPSPWHSVKWWNEQWI